MYDRIDLTSFPGQDQIIASTVQDFNDVFTGDIPDPVMEMMLMSADVPEVPEVTPGSEPSAWPEQATDPDEEEEEEEEDDEDFSDEDDEEE